METRLEKAKEYAISCQRISEKASEEARRATLQYQELVQGKKIRLTFGKKSKRKCKK
jgi:hypothetical protein